MMNTQITNKTKKTHKFSLRGWGLVIMLLMAGLFVAPAVAERLEGETIAWWVVSSGGGSSTSGGNVSIESTLGQPIAGSSSSLSIVLQAGYWHTEQSMQLFLPLLIH